MSTVLTSVSFLLSLHTSDGPTAHLYSRHMPSFSLLLSILYTLARKKNLKCKHDHFWLNLSPDNFQIKFKIFNTELFRGWDLPISPAIPVTPLSPHPYGEPQTFLQSACLSAHTLLRMECPLCSDNSHPILGDPALAPLPLGGFCAPSLPPCLPPELAAFPLAPARVSVLTQHSALGLLLHPHVSSWDWRIFKGRHRVLRISLSLAFSTTSGTWQILNK